MAFGREEEKTEEGLATNYTNGHERAASREEEKVGLSQREEEKGGGQDELDRGILPLPEGED